MSHRLLPPCEGGCGFSVITGRVGVTSVKSDITWPRGCTTIRLQELVRVFHVFNFALSFLYTRALRFKVIFHVKIRSNLDPIAANAPSTPASPAFSSPNEQHVLALLSFYYFLASYQRFINLSAPQMRLPPPLIPETILQRMRITHHVAQRTLCAG